MKKIFLLLVVFVSSVAANAQTPWVLKKDEEGIQVYTGSVEGSNIKSVKVACTLNASLSRLTTLLLDSKAHEQWVYNTKTSYLVKQLSDSSLVYYSEISMPWPLVNRDVVVEMNISQEPVTNIVHVTANAVDGYVSRNKNRVRVLKSKVSWTVKPVGNNQLSVTYVGEADPGGSIPAWLVNSFSTKGPFETFKKLKDIVASPAYSHKQYAFIKD